MQRRWALLAACTAAVSAATALRPNIVWVMADDLGWGELGLYPSSSPHGRIATPHLDRFGREGIVFTNAYAGYTVCAPSRTAFFTGRHSGQFLKHGLDGRNIHCSDKGKPVRTLAQVLQDAGYATGAFGKIAPLLCPQQQGFDTFTGQVDQALCHNMYPKKIDTGFGRLNFPLPGNGRGPSRKHCMAHPERFNYTIDVFHEEGMAWLESSAKASKPFFLYMSYTVPHAGGWGDAPQAPLQGAPVPSDLQYANEPWPDVEKDHAAVITYLDGKVGNLLWRLKALGVDNNTAVFFASDNGAHLAGGHSHKFFDSTGGLLGHKRSLFEGGVRSPTMVRWPAVVRPGQSSAFPWAFWDVLPTLAELAGAQAPPGLDGISIMPTLSGRTQEEHEYLYFTWEGTGVPPKELLSEKAAPGYAVRVGRWKGVVPHCADSAGLQPSMSDAMQLYDLEADPFETTDVAFKQVAITVRLKELVISKNLTCMCYQCSFRSQRASTMRFV